MKLTGIIALASGLSICHAEWTLRMILENSPIPDLYFAEGEGGSIYCQEVPTPAIRYSTLREFYGAVLIFPRDFG